MRSGASETGLHLIGNANPAGGAHVFVSVLEVIVREDNAAAHALDRFGDITRDPARGGVVDQIFDVGGVILSGISILAGPLSPIRVGSQGMMNAEAVRNIKLPGVMC